MSLKEERLSDDIPDPEETSSEMEPFELKILNKIASGKVPIYLAFDQIRKSFFALKLFPPDSKEFNNESRFIGLNHPNVFGPKFANTEALPVVLSEKIKVSYILSDYAPHKDFFDLLIDQDIKFDEILARTYFLQLLKAVQFLHSKNIAHLDLKLDNLVLDDEYHLKIIDFDRSFIEGDKSIQSSGTICYRAPELATKTCKSPWAADIFSCGIILFVLITGKNFPYNENIPHGALDLFALLQNNQEEFWKYHEKLLGFPGYFSEEFKELFCGMTLHNFDQRYTIQDIFNSPWCQGETYKMSGVKDQIMKAIEEKYLKQQEIVPEKV